MKVTPVFATDPGRIRDLNEDSGVIVSPPSEALRASHGALLVIADGMGGHESGEIASAQAIESVTERYFDPAPDPNHALRHALEEANRAVFERAQREGRQGMGTTVVAAAIVGERLYIAHVGDSRLYLIRDGEIAPLTRDHSLVAEQMAAGLLNEEQAENHPHRNVISRAVGTAPRVEVEIAANSGLKLQAGDVVLLCSDGLTEHVRAEQLLRLVQGRHPDEAAQALIAAANAGGGTDNISVIVAHLGEPPTRGASDLTAPAPAVRGSTAPLPQQGVAAAPPSPRQSPPRRRRGGLLPLLLLALLLSAGAGGYYLWDRGALDGLITSVPTPTLEAIGVLVTPAATPTENSSTPAASLTAAPATATLPPSPTGTAQSSASAVPASATPPPTAPSSATPAPPNTQRLINLEGPADGAVQSGPVTFGARITNLQPSDIVQLRLSSDPTMQSTLRLGLTEVGGVFQREVSAPPLGQPGQWFWSVVVITQERAPDGNIVLYQPISPRAIEWTLAPPPATPTP